MARNLSKISAVISVNTAEARQKLAGFAGDAKKYAKSLDASFQRTSTSIQQSFEKIFTEQQKVKRAIEAGRQAGVDPKVIRTFADTKALEQEANKIEALRKKAMGMTSAGGQDQAHAEVDKLTTKFTALNDKLVRTGRLSKDELNVLREMVAVSAGIKFTGITDRDRRTGYGQRINRDFNARANTQFFEEARLEESVRQLTAYRNIMRQIGATTGGPVADAFQRLKNVQAKSAKETDPNKLKKYADSIEKARAALEKLIAAEAKRQGGRSRNLSTTQGIRNQVDRQSTGFMTSDWGTRSGMAIQQLTFAFDDFNSATGGLDAKIRAMGNNISQMGLIVGGTAGLIGGVLLGVMAQLYASYLKHADAINDSTQVNKVLADQEQRLASARQKQLDIVKAIADSLEQAGLTDAQKTELNATKEAEDYRAAREAEARAQVGLGDQKLRGLRARQGQIDSEMNRAETSLPRRRELEAERRDIDRQISARERDLLDRGPEAQGVGVSLLTDFVREFNRIVERDLTFPGMADTGRQLDQILALQGQIPAEMFDQLALEFLQRWASENQPGGWNPLAGHTAGLRGVGSQAAGALGDRDAIAADQFAQGVADLIPGVRKAQQDLDSLGSMLQREFGDKIPAHFIQAADIIRDKMNAVWTALTAGEITPEQAAAEMDRLSGALGELNDAAREAASAADSERRGLSLLAQMRIDAFQREQEAKKRFYEEAEMFAFDRGMDRVRDFNLGARQTDGVTDAQAEEETVAMMMREFAPAIMQLLQAQQGALIEGRSRRSLEMQDVSTSSGAAEFARLVSQEDSAKNADLAELRKQSKLLGELVQQGEAEGII